MWNHKSVRQEDKCVKFRIFTTVTVKKLPSVIWHHRVVLVRIDVSEERIVCSYKNHTVSNITKDCVRLEDK
jgi:hypothetical protein